MVGFMKGSKTASSHLKPIPIPFQQHQHEMDTTDEVLFEPAVIQQRRRPMDTFDDDDVDDDGMMELKHNTTGQSTLFGEEDDSFYYAEEASLYSIAENSREDTIDNTTTTTPANNNNDNSIINNNKSNNPPSSFAVPQMTIGAVPADSSVSKSIRSGSQSGSNTSSRAENGTSSCTNNNNNTGNTNSSHTTPPMNNVTSFEHRKEMGIELSYAGQRGDDNDTNNSNDKNNNNEATAALDVITKASDESFRTYYYYDNNGNNNKNRNQRSSSEVAASKQLCGSLHHRRRRWYHPKCRMIIILLLILLIGIVFLSASLTIYQAHRKRHQQMKSASSIESDNDNDTGTGSSNVTTPTAMSPPTVAPSSIRGNNQPTNMPLSLQDVKLIVSENYVYNAIKTCQGTHTFFDTTTIQGQVYTLLVQEVYENVFVVATNDDSSDISSTTPPKYEFAAYHTVNYLREKYSLNVLFLYTNGMSSWRNHTNWTSLTNPCGGTEDAPWYGIQCSSPYSTSSNSTSSTGSSASSSTLTEMTESTSRSSPTFCDATVAQHVVAMDLSNNNLTGILPDELCCMPCIERINISNNSISGDLVWCINEMSTLVDLNVNFNPFQPSASDDAARASTTPPTSIGAGIIDIP